MLRQIGPALWRPLVATVKGSKHKNMKELRPPSSGSTEVRVLFAFDPLPSAILLLGGDKSGEWRKWYATNIPTADALYDEHLSKLAAGAAAPKPTRRKRGKR